MLQIATSFEPCKCQIPRGVVRAEMLDDRGPQFRVHVWILQQAENQPAEEAAGGVAAGEQDGEELVAQV